MVDLRDGRAFGMAVYGPRGSVLGIPMEFFSFIALDPRDDDTEADCEWLIDRAGDAVIRDGANMLIVDPWNEVEHRRRGNESVADYTNRAIRSFKRFASSYDVCTAIVAHPTKAVSIAQAPKL